MLGFRLEPFMSLHGLSVCGGYPDSTSWVLTSGEGSCVPLVSRSCCHASIFFLIH